MIRRHYRRAFRTVLAVTTAAFWVGCAAAATGVEPQLAPTSELAAVTYSSFAASYRVVTHGRVEQEFNGQTVASDYTLRYHLSAEIVPSDTAFRVSLTLDSVPEFSGVGLGPFEADGARGLRFSGTLSPNGRLTEVTASDPSSPVAAQIANQLKQFFPRIPAGGARAQAQWRDTTETTSRASGLALSIRAETASEAVEWTQYGGVRALHIRTVSTYTLSGGGTQQGQQITLDGTGTRRSDEFLSADGRYLGMTATDTTRLSAMLEATGAVIPIVQTRADTLAIQS
jgi:hypothetical protein